MLEILKFYVSSFWVWLGITIGISILAQMITSLVGIVAGAIVVGKKPDE